MTCKYHPSPFRILTWSRRTDDEANRYPPKMIPGFHVTVHTTATNDRDGRLLLGTLGIPFYGKQIN